jgi:hypothetical protein
MRKRARVRELSSNLQLEIGIPTPMTERNLDPKTRAEVIALIARLLLDAAQRSQREVGDDAS